MKADDVAFCARAPPKRCRYRNKSSILVVTAKAAARRTTVRFVSMRPNLGVVIGRAAEFFDFFVYGIGSVLVFPYVFFPFAEPVTATKRTTYFQNSLLWTSAQRNALGLLSALP